MLTAIYGLFMFSRRIKLAELFRPYPTSCTGDVFRAQREKMCTAVAVSLSVFLRNFRPLFRNL